MVQTATIQVPAEQVDQFKSWLDDYIDVAASGTAEGDIEVRTPGSGRGTIYTGPADALANTAGHVLADMIDDLHEMSNRHDSPADAETLGAAANEISKFASRIQSMDAGAEEAV